MESRGWNPLSQGRYAEGMSQEEQPHVGALVSRRDPSGLLFLGTTFSPIFFTVIFVLLGVRAAAEDIARLPEFSPQALMAHVKFLAGEELEGRGAGTRGERIAALYAATRMEAAGVPAPAWGRYQRFPLSSPPGKAQADSLNVFGWIDGRDPGMKGEWIVLGAHMDHLGADKQGADKQGADKQGAGEHGADKQGFFPGAEDNASGVAVLLEIAAALARDREGLGRAVLIVFFGSEEASIAGSRHFVKNCPGNLREIAAMINVDSIGRPLADKKPLAPLKKLLGFEDRKTLGVVGALERPLFCEIVEEATKQAGIECFGTRNLPLVSSIVENLAKHRSDNGPFEEAGIPTLFFGSGESDDYHLHTDTPDKLDGEILALRARAIHATLVALSRVPREKLPKGEGPRPRPESRPSD